MIKNKKLIQILAEGLIPVLGFFLWDWSLYFILLFYLTDLITNEVFYHLKSRIILKFLNQKAQQINWKKLGFLSFSLFLLIVYLIHIVIRKLHPEIIFFNEILNFWNYEEMGLKQGYLLVPAIIFIGYQQYKTEFILTGEFKKTTTNQLWKKHIQALLVMIAFAGLSAGLLSLVNLSETAFVVGIVVFSSLYSLKFN